MILLQNPAGNGDLLEVACAQAVTTDVHVSYVDITAAGAVTLGRQNTTIASAATVDVAGACASGSTRNIKTVNVRNKHATSSVDVTVQHHVSGGVTATLHKVTLAAGDALEYVEGLGFSKLAAAPPALGIVGTPSITSAQSIPVAATLVLGTSVQLPTSNLVVGSHFRFNIGVTKGGAGTATWTAVVKYGTLGTTGDAAIATFTSGTNTGVADVMAMEIDVRVLTLGVSATAACAMRSSHSASNITGLGDMTLVPGSTATFDSTATTPFFHVDITPGASAVMTATAYAERLA